MIDKKYNISIFYILIMGLIITGLFVLLIISLTNNFYLYYKYKPSMNKNMINNTIEKVNLYYIKNGKDSNSFDEVKIIGSTQSDTTPRSSLTTSGSGIFSGNQTLDQVRTFMMNSI